MRLFRDSEHGFSLYALPSIMSLYIYEAGEPSKPPAKRLVAFLYGLKAGRMVRFTKTDVDVVLARPHAPGRLGTSQLSNPGTQWVAPSAGIAQPRSHRSIDIVEMFHKSPFSAGWTTRG